MNDSKKNIYEGKQFFEVNAQFLVHFDGMDQLDETDVLTRIIYMVHDCADLSRIDARRIIVGKAEESAFHKKQILPPTDE